MKDDFAPQETFDNVWKHFWLSQPGGRVSSIGTWWGVTKDTAMYRTVSPNVNNAEIEKPYYTDIKYDEWRFYDLIEKK